MNLSVYCKLYLQNIEYFAISSIKNVLHMKESLE